LANGILEAKRRFPRQYYEVALTHGVRKRDYFIFIEIPLIIRQALPSILIVLVNVLHMTLFAGLISVDEMFRTALRINSIEYKPVEVFTILALFFILLSTPLLLLSILLRRKFSVDLSER
jgi:ABC-type amino acid transport system permease subunit